MFIHNKIARSGANGPGERSVVWLQGCTLKCASCWNPETHAFAPEKDMLISEVADWILAQDVEGVTFSGGEPFQQAPALNVLIDYLKERRPGFTVGSFTGYTRQELEAGKFQWWNPSLSMMVPGDAKLAKEILSRVDFIIAGRYNELQRCDDKPLCGSRNQEVHFLTKRYSAKDLNPNNIVEMDVNLDEGLIQITGFPETLDPIDHPRDEDEGELELACA